MTDTAALIERLRRKFSFYRDPDNSARWIAHERHVDEDCVEAANALSHLTTPPLPEDIAGLFDTVEEYLGDTEHWELADDSTPDPTDAANSLHKLRATLRALAQENERLKAQPLPEEIAGLIERVESSIRAYEVTHNEDSQACRLLRYLA